MTAKEAAVLVSEKRQAATKAKQECLEAIKEWWRLFSRENALDKEVQESGTGRLGFLFWRGEELCFKKNSSKASILIWAAGDYINHNRFQADTLHGIERLLLHTFSPFKE